MRLWLVWVCAIGLITGCVAGNNASQGISENASKAGRYVVLIGPPGSGKGVLADSLSKSEGLPVITASQVLKNIKGDGDLAKKVNGLMAAGQLVPDEVVAEVMLAEIAKPKYAKGAIFDGFPRTTKQAVFFEDNRLNVELVVVLYADDEVLVSRIGGRRVHLPSGRVYHIDSMPPKVAGKDDLTGEPLTQRKDDTEATIRKRLDDYRKQTEPVAAWAIFEQMKKDGVVEHVVIVDAGQTIDNTWSSVCTKLAADKIDLQGCANGEHTKS